MTVEIMAAQTIRRVIRPRKKWQKNNNWHMKCLPPHLSYDLKMIVKGIKCENPDCKRYKHMGGRPECHQKINS